MTCLNGHGMKTANTITTNALLVIVVPKMVNAFATGRYFVIQRVIVPPNVLISAIPTMVSVTL